MPLPIATVTLPAARLGVPTSRLTGATVIPDTCRPEGTVSVTVTVDPWGKLGPRRQRPPGGLPAWTVNEGADPAVKVKLLPGLTPARPTLQIFNCPHWTLYRTKPLSKFMLLS